VNISKYLADLLERQEYVIIPGIGALMSTYQSAVLEEKSRTLLPPSRRFSFNPGLTVNDGMLAGYIAQKEKITLTRAKALVEQFAEEVTYRLHRGETVDLENIGKLKEKNGLTEFIPDAATLPLPDTFGLGRVELPSSGLPPGIEKQIEKEKVSPAGKWKRNLALVLCGGLLLLLLFFVLFNPGRKNSEKGTQHTEVNPPPADQEQPGQSLPPVAGDTITPTTPSLNLDPPADASPENWYYLVGGSFKSAENAGAYMTKMESKGFHPVLLGKVGNFFVVALDSFPTSSEATKASYSFSSLLPDDDFWIYHKKK